MIDQTPGVDWPPQSSAASFSEGQQRHGSTGQLFEVRSGRWERVIEDAPKAEKRKTVNVNNGTGRSIMLHLHQTVDDDGGGRAFQGRALSSFSDGIPDAVQLKSGHNAGIDKEFFDEWLKQNKAFAEGSITAEEENPEAESAKREEHD